MSKIPVVISLNAYLASRLLLGSCRRLCLLFHTSKLFFSLKRTSACLMFTQNATLESLLKYCESHANTDYKSTTVVSFSFRGYSAASHSSRSHANAGKLGQWSLSLCFFSGWTWFFLPITFSCVRWKLKEKRELLYYSQKVSIWWHVRTMYFLFLHLVDWN